MNTVDNTRRLLTEHYKKYPKMLIVDIFKFLHQSAFGCEHLVTSLNDAKARITEEAKTLRADGNCDIEMLDGEYCRVPLAVIKTKADIDTLANAFYLSAKKEPDGATSLESKLNIAKELIQSGTLPFDMAEFETQVALWKEQGYPAVRHSEVFRQEYAPAYRVIANKYTDQFNL